MPSHTDVVHDLDAKLTQEPANRSPRAGIWRPMGSQFWFRTLSPAKGRSDSVDVATLIDFFAHPFSGPRGCVLELFNAVGDSIRVVTVPEDAVGSLRADEVLSVRPMDASE